MARLLEHRLVRLLLISAVAWVLREVLITKPPGFGVSDLLPSYVFPHMLVEHGPARVYLSMGFPYPEAAPADLVAMNRRFVGAAWYPTGFMYHPWTLFLLTPLAFALSLSAFVRLFLALNAVASVYVGLFTGDLLGLTRREGALLALVLALAVPFTDAAALGQNTVIAAALILRGFNGVLEGRAPTAAEGGLLLVATLLKPWAILVLLVPVLAGRWRASVALVGAYVALGEVLPMLLLPRALTSGWRQAQRWMEEAALLQHNNGSLRCFLTRLVPAWHVPYDVFPTVPTPVWWTEKLVAAGIGAVALALAIRRRPSPRDATLGGLALVLVPLSTLWVHYTVLLIPGALVLAATRRGVVRAVGGIAAALLVVAPNHTLFAALVPSGSEAWRADPRWALLGLLPWAIAVVVGLLLLSTRPVSARTPTDPPSASGSHRDTDRTTGA